MQTWVGNNNFLYCDWVAKSDENVYSHLDALELDGKVINAMVSEMFQFVSAYRAPDDIIRQHPEADGKW